MYLSNLFKIISSIGYPADSQVNGSSNGVSFTSPSGSILEVRVSNSGGMQLSDYSQYIINVLNQVLQNPMVHSTNGDVRISGD
ncbi:MAG: hypothetical protein WA667_07450 [Candidatus Nitrosopolaris sp.]